MINPEEKQLDSLITCLYMRYTTIVVAATVQMSYDYYNQNLHFFKLNLHVMEIFRSNETNCIYLSLSNYIISCVTNYIANI